MRCTFSPLDEGCDLVVRLSPMCSRNGARSLAQLRSRRANWRLLQFPVYKPWAEDEVSQWSSSTSEPLLAVESTVTSGPGRFPLTLQAPRLYPGGSKCPSLGVPGILQRMGDSSVESAVKGEDCGTGCSACWPEIFQILSSSPRCVCVYGVG